MYQIASQMLPWNWDRDYDHANLVAESVAKVAPKNTPGSVEDGGEGSNDGQEVIVANELLTVSLVKLNFFCVQLIEKNCYIGKLKIPTS